MIVKVIFEVDDLYAEEDCVKEIVKDNFKDIFKDIPIENMVIEYE